MSELTTGLRASAPASRFPLEAASRLLFKASADAHYRLRRAECDADVRAAQTLRFLVFNIELNEGLEKSFATLRDEDAFDAVCEHLLVEDTRTGEVVGTYRLQTGRKARENLGFYSEQEFDFTPFRPIQDQLVELGRACVHIDHRGLAVLGLLWRGIIEFAQANGARYLIGCSSLTSQDEGVGSAAYRELARDHLAPAEFQTRPLPQLACALNDASELRPKLPKLLRAYLSLGAKICGPPAIDREFKTIDFLTLIDLEDVREQAKARR